MAEKHINWFALEKACAKPGCPICTIVRDRSARYIDNMLFEHVSDRGFRARYRESLGFCREHARNLESFRDGLAVAILGEDILSHIMPDLKRGKSTKVKGICPACAESQRVEREFAGFLAESEDQALKDIFMASEGLCVPHYRLLVTTVRRVPKWLRDFHEKRYEDLLVRARNFIEFSAWGRQDDFAALSAEDKVVWKEIARALRGDGD